MGFEKAFCVSWEGFWAFGFGFNRRGFAVCSQGLRVIGHVGIAFYRLRGWTVLLRIVSMLSTGYIRIVSYSILVIAISLQYRIVIYLQPSDRISDRISTAPRAWEGSCGRLESAADQGSQLHP